RTGRAGPGRPARSPPALGGAGGGARRSGRAALPRPRQARDLPLPGRWPLAPRAVRPQADAGAPGRPAHAGVADPGTADRAAPGQGAALLRTPAPVPALGPV